MFKLESSILLVEYNENVLNISGIADEIVCDTTHYYRPIVVNTEDKLIVDVFKGYDIETNVHYLSIDIPVKLLKDLDWDINGFSINERYNEISLFIDNVQYYYNLRGIDTDNIQIYLYRNSLVTRNSNDCVRVYYIAEKDNIESFVNNNIISNAELVHAKWG